MSLLLAAALLLSGAARAQDNPAADYVSPLGEYYLELPARWWVGESKGRSDFSHPDKESRCTLTVLSLRDPFVPELLDLWKGARRRNDPEFRLITQEEASFGSAPGRLLDYRSGGLRHLGALVASANGSFELDCAYPERGVVEAPGELCREMLASFKPNPGRLVPARRLNSSDGAFTVAVWPGWRDATSETYSKVPDTVLSLSRPAGTVNIRSLNADPASLPSYVEEGARVLAAQAGAKPGPVQALSFAGGPIYLAEISLSDRERLTGGFSVGDRSYAVESVSRSPGLTRGLTMAVLSTLKGPGQAGAAAPGTEGSPGSGRAYLLAFIFGAVVIAFTYAFAMLYLSLPLLEQRAASMPDRAPAPAEAEEEEEAPKPAPPTAPAPAQAAKKAPAPAQRAAAPKALGLAAAAAAFLGRFKRPAPKPAAAPKTAGPKRVGVIGAGTMGAGIAQLLAQNGVDVALYDVSPAALRAGIERVRAGLEKAGKREALTRLEPCEALEALASTDLVIEAAAEDLEVKRALFKTLSALMPAPKVLASNTSSLSIKDIAEAAAAPERVVGLHFFNPAPLMRLIEVVPHEGSSPAARQSAVALAKRLGKTPVLSADAPGFIANRLVRPFYLKPLQLLSAGAASASDLDEAFRRQGFKMGPFQLMDLIGMDVNLAITQGLHRSLGEKFKPSPLQEELVRRGHYGRKSGAGFYVYEGSRPKGENPVLKELVSAAPAAKPDLDALFRMVLDEVAGEARLLVEQKVATEADVDTAMKLGLNWPKGPLEWKKELAA